MKKFFSVMALCALFFTLCSCGLASKAGKKSVTEEFLYMEGLRGYHQGNYRYAEDCFKRVLKINPLHDASLYYLANISYMGGDLTRTLQYMKAATKADPTNYWYQTQIAQLYMMENKVDAAIAVYEDLLSRYPRKRDLYYDLANIYLSHRDTEKALALLDRIEEMGGASESTGFYRFNVLLMQGKQEEATQVMEQLAATHSSSRSYAILGDLYAESGRDSLALVCYDRAIALDPGYMPAIFGQAEIYRMKRQFGLFFQNMYLIMDHPDVDASLKRDYMEQLMQNRAFVGTFLPQVDSLFSKMYARHQTDTAIIYSYAIFLVQSGKDRAAVDVLQKNVERNPYSRSAWSHRLLIYYHLQQWSELYALAKEATQRFPKDPELATMMGIAVWRLDNIPEAVKIFETILPMAKGNRAMLAQTYSILGDLYHATQQPKKSFKAYEQSLKIDPNQNGALNNYAYFLALAGKELPKAYEMSKRTIEAEPQNATYLDTFGWILYKMGRFEEAKAIFRQVMVYGGRELGAEVLDHYAEVLFALKEYDMAFIYWEQAKAIEKNEELEKKISLRKTQMKQ